MHGAAIMGQYIMESALVNETFDTKHINLSTSHSIAQIRKFNIRKWGRWISLLWKSCATYIKFKPDVVYMTLTAEGSGFYKDFPVVMCLKILGAKICYHFHNKGVHRRENNQLHAFLYRLVFRNSSVILLSPLLYYDVQKFIPRDRTYFCANGIPDINTGTGSKLSEGKDGNKLKILFLSNLIKTKGIYVLLEACSSLREKSQDFICTIVGKEGDISKAQLLAQIKAQQLEEYVYYAGPKYGPDKIQAYREADIFTFPTYYPNECQPLVIIEAMQFGLPVVATREGSIPEMIADGETGFLVKRENREELSEKLEILIQDAQLRQKMGVKARERYLQKYAISKFETRLVSVINEILETE